MPTAEEKRTKMGHEVQDEFDAMFDDEQKTNPTRPDVKPPQGPLSVNKLVCCRIEPLDAPDAVKKAPMPNGVASGNTGGRFTKSEEAPTAVGVDLG